MEKNSGADILGPQLGGDGPLWVTEDGPVWSLEELAEAAELVGPEEWEPPTHPDDILLGRETAWGLDD